MTIQSLIVTIGSGGLVGFALGLLGGGGSILATPLLLYVVGVTNPISPSEQAQSQCPSTLMPI